MLSFFLRECLFSDLRVVYFLTNQGALCIKSMMKLRISFLKRVTLQQIEQKVNKIEQCAGKWKYVCKAIGPEKLEKILFAFSSQLLLRRARNIFRYIILHCRYEHSGQKLILNQISDLQFADYDRSNTNTSLQQWGQGLL